MGKGKILFRCRFTGALLNSSYPQKELACGNNRITNGIVCRFPLSRGYLPMDYNVLNDRWRFQLMVMVPTLLRAGQFYGVCWLLRPNPKVPNPRLASALKLPSVVLVKEFG